MAADRRAGNFLAFLGQETPLPKGESLKVVQSLLPKGPIGGLLQTALMTAECVTGQRSAIVGRLATLGVPSTQATAVDIARRILPSGSIGSALLTALVPAGCIAAYQARSKPPAVLTSEQQARIATLKGAAGHDRR